MYVRVYRFRSEGIVAASPETVFDLAAPSAGKPGRCKWDTSVASSVVIEQIAPVRRSLSLSLSADLNIILLYEALNVYYRYTHNYVI